MNERGSDAQFEFCPPRGDRIDSCGPVHRDPKWPKHARPPFWGGLRDYRALLVLCAHKNPLACLIHISPAPASLRSTRWSIAAAAGWYATWTRGRS